MEKAFAVVRVRAYQILDGLQGKRPLADVIADIAKAMQAGCRLNTRRKHPNASQLWLDGLDWDLKWV